MSGGSMDYLYCRVEDACFDLNTPERKAFAVHLKLVAKALHDIEWVDSCDYGKGDETAAIMACISRADVLDEVIHEAERVRDELSAVIEEASND